MISTDFIKGVIVPIITPIDAEERIDEARLRRQVDFVIEGGLHGILAFGFQRRILSAGRGRDAPGVTDHSRAGRRPCPPYISASALSTQRNAAVWQRWQWKTAQWGVSILQPMFLKPTEEELFQHFKAIAQAVPETPVLLYNNPGRGWLHHERESGGSSGP